MFPLKACTIYSTSHLDRALCDFHVVVKYVVDKAQVETRSLIEHMKKGENLVHKCSKIPWWNYLFKVYYSPKLKELEDEIVRFYQVDLQVHNTRNGLRTLEMVISISKRMGSFKVVETVMGSSHRVARLRELKVGLDMPIKELKTLLLKNEVQRLLLTAPRGCGKTTLVKMLCQDEELRLSNYIVFGWLGTIKENILFVTVSKTPNMKLIVQSLFNYKNLWLEFQFQSNEDAIDNLPQLLNHIGLDPISLVLDDVWLGSESQPEKFKFDILDYKILVTSRTAFPRFEFTYHLKLLNGGDFKFPDDKVIFKNCFMDLGLFPEDQRIPAVAFIDMLAELYELDEDGIQAIANLQELTNWNLASFVMSRKDASEVNNYYNEDFVTQQDILRELAMYQSSQGLREQRQRLIINISKNNPPKWWTEQK
uniref:RPW8 domain-containing protein n=1 Tax=Quercus lobata TaxID=97700 RepID=A0A7N2M0T9_QUELO